MRQFLFLSTQARGYLQNIQLIISLAACESGAIVRYHHQDIRQQNFRTIFFAKAVRQIIGYLRTAPVISTNAPDPLENFVTTA